MNFWNIIIGIVTIASSIFGLSEFFRRRKLEQFTKSTLQGIAGNVAKIRQSTMWTFNNLKNAQNEAVKLPESDNKREIILKISDGQADAASADRMIVNLFNEVLTFQEAQFGTRKIAHSEKKDLELAQKEVNL